MDVRFEPLDLRKHDRAAFSCGHERIDQYLKQVAVQASERFSARTVVLVEASPATTAMRPILGFFTLALHVFRDKEMDQVTARALKVKNLGSVPAVLIGQLAVAKEWQNRRLGPRLLEYALRESLRGAKIVGGSLVITDPIDRSAASFYERFGFKRILPNEERLYLPMKTIARAYASNVAEPGGTPDVEHPTS